MQEGASRRRVAFRSEKPDRMRDTFSVVMTLSVVNALDSRCPARDERQIFINDFLKTGIEDPFSYARIKAAISVLRIIRAILTMIASKKSTRREESWNRGHVQGAKTESRPKTRRGLLPTFRTKGSCLRWRHQKVELTQSELAGNAEQLSEHVGRRSCQCWQQRGRKQDPWK